MIFAAHLVLTLLAGCSGLFFKPEPDMLGQTGSTSTRVDSAGSDSSGGGLLGTEAGVAEAAAQRALELAREAEREVHDSLSLRKLEAMDSRAQAEARTEFTKQAKLDAMSDRMIDEFGVAVKKYASDRKHQENVERRALESYNSKMRRLDRRLDMEEDADWAEQHRALNAADQARNALDRLDRMEQREEARYERSAQKELRHLWKKIHEDEAKERVDQKRHREREAETSTRLWEKASELRRSAEVAAAEAPASRAEVLQLLDITEDDLDNMTATLANFSKGGETGSWFAERVRGVGFKSTAASARLLETVLHRVSVLKSHHQEVTGPQLVHEIVRLLNETRSAARLLQDESARIESRIEGWSRANPENLSYKLSLALHGVTGNVEFRNHLFQTDLKQLQHANQTEACGLLSSVFTENMAPAFRSLGHMREKLDKMAKVVPSVVSSMPFASQVMAGRSHDLLNMAYTEHLAFQESATSILRDVAPIVAERLDCVFSGSTQATLRFTCAFVFASLSWLAL